MRIKRLTITGADNGVHPNKLAKLSAQYPFVEWGILFGSSESVDRFPSEEWRTSFMRSMPRSTNISAHLCGSYMKSVLQEGDFTMINVLSTIFDRIQLNVNFTRSKKCDIYKLGEYFAQNPYSPNIILQMNGANEAAIIDVIGIPWMSKVDLLFDSSGGRGEVITKIEAPQSSNHTGYAGGLDPDNVSVACDRIIMNQSPADVWLDLESGARKNNHFNLQSVQSILKTVNNYV